MAGRAPPARLPPCLKGAALPACQPARRRAERAGQGSGRSAGRRCERGRLPLPKVGREPRPGPARAPCPRPLPRRSGPGSPHSAALRATDARGEVGPAPLALWDGEAGPGVAGGRVPPWGRSPRPFVRPPPAGGASSFVPPPQQVPCLLPPSSFGLCPCSGEARVSAAGAGRAGGSRAVPRAPARGSDWEEAAEGGTLTAGGSGV